MNLMARHLSGNGHPMFIIPPRDDGLGQRKSFCRNPAAGGTRRQYLILETKHG
jgi:hypothetical protein